MKIIEYEEKKGILRVVPEDVDDLWVLYNVIHQGDYISARTSRGIKNEEEATRPSKGKRVVISLGINVEKLTLNSIDNRLRVNGVIKDAPDKFSLIGSHHTISITLDKPITIIKNRWLRHDIERIKFATRNVDNKIIIVSMDDEKGCVAVLRQHGIDIGAEIESRLPRKREIKKRENVFLTFFKSILNELIYVWNKNQSLIVVIGPGFWKENFVKFVKDRQPEIFRSITAIRNVGNGGVAGVNEAVRSGILRIVSRRLRVIEETRAVEEMLSRLGAQNGHISYGFENVKRAINSGAVDLLLVADTLLRTPDEKNREAMEAHLRDVEKMRGRVMIISSEHEAGDKLLSLGGIAAILRYSLD